MRMHKQRRERWFVPLCSAETEADLGPVDSQDRTAVVSRWPAVFHFHVSSPAAAASPINTRSSFDK